MAETPSITLTYNYAEEAQARQAFQSHYGLAMMEWAELESTLALWFALIAGVSEQMARAIFYSAASFRPRLDMVYAALTETTLDGETIQFLKSVCSKSRRYSVFRNSMAHGQTHWNMIQQTSTYKQFVMMEGANQSVEALEAGITIKKLEIAVNNFRELRRLTTDMFPGLRQSRPEITPEVHRLLVHQLPTEACSDEPNRNHLPQAQRASAERT